MEKDVNFLKKILRSFESENTRDLRIARNFCKGLNMRGWSAYDIYPTPEGSRDYGFARERVDPRTAAATRELMLQIVPWVYRARFSLDLPQDEEDVCWIIASILAADGWEIWNVGESNYIGEWGKPCITSRRVKEIYEELLQEAAEDPYCDCKFERVNGVLRQTSEGYQRYKDIKDIRAALRFAIIEDELWRIV